MKLSPQRRYRATGYSVFYGRDRGETGQGPKTLPKFMFHYDFKRAYRYVFKNGEWFQTTPRQTKY